MNFSARSTPAESLKLEAVILNRWCVVEAGTRSSIRVPIRLCALSIPMQKLGARGRYMSRGHR